MITQAASESFFWGLARNLEKEGSVVTSLSVWTSGRIYRTDNNWCDHKFCEQQLFLHKVKKCTTCENQYDTLCVGCKSFSIISHRLLYNRHHSDPSFFFRLLGGLMLAHFPSGHKLKMNVVAGKTWGHSEDLTFGTEYQFHRITYLELELSVTMTLTTETVVEQTLYYNFTKRYKQTWTNIKGVMIVNFKGAVCENCKDTSRQQHITAAVHEAVRTRSS